MGSSDDFEREVASGDRFQFGKNWQHFISRVSERTLDQAAVSLRRLVGNREFSGARFLDAGSGSGLFSAAARKLGGRVTSFDYDAQSYECTRELRHKFPALADDWRVLRGSVLDAAFLDSLGSFDIVYCWGVAHHSGDMWHALANLADRVDAGGVLAISIYNDQGKPSKRWLRVKRLYNRYSVLRAPIIGLTLVRFWAVKFTRDLIHGKPLKSWREYGDNDRGMSAWHDLIDWVGGYPFEVAKPEEVFHYFSQKGFVLRDLKTHAGGIACNEYLFEKTRPTGEDSLRNQPDRLRNVDESLRDSPA